jgi:hypothetical protein
MVKLLITAIIIFSSRSIGAQSVDEQAIHKVLDAQETAWNSGNIENFMKGYWVSDSLIFIGKSVSYGWKETLASYKKRYPDTASMGKLSFDFLQIKALTPLYYYVIGKWSLQRSVGNIGGYFTLLFQKIKGQWLIIADHSS